MQAYNFRMFLDEGRPALPQAARLRRRATTNCCSATSTPAAGPAFYPHAGDNNNQGGFSTDNIGRSYDWPDGTARGDLSVKKDEAYFKALYETREKVYQDHVSYQQGLVYFLAHDERVPQAVRDEASHPGA